MNLCCKLVAGVYTPTIHHIPISKDEQLCMREAQFHSAEPPISVPNQSPTSVSPLDPGSRPGQQSLRNSKASGAGANSLLKQAIANRLVPHATTSSGGESPTNQNISSFPATSPTTESGKVHKTDSSEMSKSVLLNPAWYRDEQGRTGYKTSDWEKISNQQKNVVKESKKRRKESIGETGLIKELDTDLLSQSSIEKTESGSDNGSNASMLSDQKCAMNKINSNDSKLDKKAFKLYEKERKKLEKEQKKLEKAKNKKESKEGKQNKMKKGNLTNISEVGEHQSVEVNTVEKKKEKTEATIRMKMASQDKSSKHRKDTDGLDLHEVTDSHIPEESQKRIKQRSKEDNKEQTSKEDESNKTSKESEEKPKTSITHLSLKHLKSGSSRKTGHGEPKKQNIGDRRDSNMSQLSKASFKSVTFNDRVQTHEIERNSSVYTSSEDDAAIMSDDEMPKISQLKTRKKIALLQKDHPFYKKPSMESQQQRRSGDIDDDEDLEDFEEQERLALWAAQGYDYRREMLYRKDDEDKYENEYEEEEEDNEDEDTLSQNSYYAEDVEGADIYLRNEHSFLGTDMTKQPQQILNVEENEIIDRGLMGSMSKLHGEDSASNSLLFGYNLPRSASGYFEPPPDNGYMNVSYEEAILNRQGHALQQQQLLQHLQNLPNQLTQPRHEHSGVHNLSPTGRYLRQTATQRSVYENVTSEDAPSQPHSIPISLSSSQKTQLARHEFFTQTPSNIISKTTMAASSDGQSVQSLGSTDSNATIKAEDEMRKKFVARFGVRKAPIAKEEDPVDPHHVNIMGSQESMVSTDSRESVVSAASIKAEALARRNFNY